MSDILWTCKGCGISVGTESVPVERLAGKTELVWLYLVFEPDRVELYTSVELPETEPTETPAFEIDGQPYCPECAQACANCGTPIFSRSELEAGDTYAAGSAFLPEGEFRKDDALCVDCFSECCDICGASPTEECTCDPGEEEEACSTS